jgi:autotransporter-associated beta strand protein
MISFRNGSNTSLNEPNINCFDFGSYYSFGLGYEQDAWYPTVSPASFYGNSSLATGTSYYGNNTTVSISGTSAGQGPVPYWQTMYYMWGYGLGGVDSNYAPVSGTPTSTSWTHSQTGVTGHRRFHLFAVSQSGRTSFQSSGSAGGSTFQDSGSYARYYDLWVDNAAPNNGSFSTASATSTTAISLGWAIPLDNGVGVAAGSTEAKGSIASDADANNYYRVGDVGCQVYRNTTNTISAWSGSTTTVSDTGLTANTAYTYTIEARDNSSGGRGSWNNTTGPQGSTVVWTLPIAPTSGSVTPSTAFQCSSGSAVTWTAVGGFGAGHIQNYRYVWDQNATHTWADTESLWSSGTLNTTPTSGGNWYLHVKGYNGAAVGNGTYDYAVVVSQGTEKWTGGNGNWDFSTTGLWQDATPNAVTYCDGHAVLLDDSASVSTPAVTLTTAVAPSSVTNNSTKNYTIAGTGKITGSASLTKQGASTLTLSTANDYSGITTVSAGTLALSGSGSIAGSPTNIVASGATFNVSAVTGGFHLASGQTLTGTGTNLGPVTINSGATLAPGAGATLGTLTVSNNLTLAGSANLRISKSGSTLTSDQIAGTGTLTKGGTLNVTLVSGSSPLADGDTFPLFSAASSTGAFAVTNLPSVGAGTNWWTTNNYGTLTLNVWPTAGGVTYSRAQGISLKIKIADVLTNLTGAITGKTIGLAGVGTSTNSATITTNSTYIFYSPATGNNNDEYFSYTATDGRGGSPANNIYVTVIKWTGTAQTITVTNNTVTLNFAGIPNYGYAIQRSTNLTDWVTLVTTNAPSAGLFQWTDDFSDLGGPPASAYYRLQQP